MRRLPFLELCTGCPFEAGCLAAHTDHRCNDPAIYPHGGLHPEANPVETIGFESHVGIQGPADFLHLESREK